MESSATPSEPHPSPTRFVMPIVVGTRPEAIKLIPVILALRESPFRGHPRGHRSRAGVGRRTHLVPRGEVPSHARLDRARLRAAMRDQAGRPVGFAVAHAHAFCTWLLWPVLARSVVRQLRNRRDWAKTGREPISGRSARSP